jgi:hypothetical protein
MKRWTILCTCVAWLVAGCGSDTVDIPEYDGAMLFQGYCASCHGPDGRGDGPIAGSFDINMEDLRTIRTRNDGVFDRQALRTMIEGSTLRLVHGSPDMPVWGWVFYREEWRMGEKRPRVFADARIDALLDHLESIQTP